MFSSHLATFNINRSEPDSINSKDCEYVKIKFSKLAEQIVLKSILKAPKDPRSKKALEKKIKGKIEFEERFKSVKSFMELWNKWRLFYFDLDPIEPKNSHQLTAIENAIEFAKDNDLDMNMLIGCVHCAFRKRRFKPNFTNLYDKGIDLYEKFYDKVLGDLDRDEYHDSSSKRLE